MEEYYVLHVDNLLRKSKAAEAALLGRKLLVDKLNVHDGKGISMTELVECRICHDEDEEFNMEIPCACCGTMKYAHRKCIQRWCDEKGDISCEICRQPFIPGYTTRPKPIQNGRMPMNLITSAQFDGELMQTEHEENSISRRRSIVYCRSIALSFMIILFLREALPMVFNGAEEYSILIFMKQVLKTAVIVLPLYIMLRAATAFQCRHQQLQRLQERGEISTNLGRE
ncbi:hypothetical protein KSP39_PZI023502 [Platanthera zijinensis]|uniref:RING-CH-type domain-containing protein n=1 Tax=Platanthera zijinensis TaxID=2320716 RepID=A0AAP0ASW0_9ASPA